MAKNSVSGNKIIKKITFWCKNVIKLPFFNSFFHYKNGNTWCYNTTKENQFNDKGGNSMYKASDIAKYIVQISEKEGHPISNLQLQKILYYVQGYFLKQFNTCAFNEKIYNWPYGPVVQDAYFEYNIYGGQKIDYIPDYEEPVSFDSRDHKKCIEQVVKACLCISPGKLVEQTHQEDPWKNTVRRSEIEPQDIETYFKKNDPLKIM